MDKTGKPARLDKGTQGLEGDVSKMLLDLQCKLFFL